jgi:hypothetical protein
MALLGILVKTWQVLLHSKLYHFIGKPYFENAPYLGVSSFTELLNLVHKLYHSKIKWSRLNKSISNGAQYVTSVQKYFSHPSFSYLLPSSNHTHETKTGIANRWETITYLVANHLDQSLWKTGSTSLIIFITLFLERVFSFAVPFAIHSMQQKWWAKTILLLSTICLAKQICFDFSSSNFNWQRLTYYWAPMELLWKLDL